MVSVSQTRNRISTIDWSFTANVEFWFESMWLSALALVPILFSYRSTLYTFEEAKSYALHFFALAILVLLVWDAANRFVAARQRGEDVGSFDVGAWLLSDRANLLLGTIAIFTFIYVISSVLSPMPYYSIWGISPATTGYNLYSFISMMIIMLAVVTRVRSREQVWKIVYVISAVGVVTSIYGISQHFGWDPLFQTRATARVISSLGNPIYFGAYLVISTPMTVAVAIRFANSRKYQVLALLTICIALQFTAMWFTGSRGPLVGLAAAGAVTFASMLLFTNRRTALRVSTSVAAATVIAVILVFASGDIGDTRAVQFSGELSDLTSNDGSGSVQAGLGGRGEIWADIAELAVRWETLPPETGPAKVLRPLFGFGPDMLRFSTSLVAGPRDSLQIVDHAHNRPLQVLAEQGWLGLVVFLIIGGLVIWLVITIGRKIRRAGAQSPNVTIAFIAVAGALSGVAVEQMAGVGRVSDLLTSWVVIGLLVVLFRSVTGTRVLEDSGSVESVEVLRTSSRSISQRRSTSSLSVLPFVVGLTAAVAAITLFALVDGQMLRSSRMVLGLSSGTSANDVYIRLIEARDISPQVEHFTILPAEILIDDSRELLQLGENREAVRLAEQAFRLLLDYHERNPLAIKTRIVLAETAALLVEIGAVDFKDEMVIRYEELAAQFPSEARVLAVVANAYASAELFDKSIAMADRSIELEAVTRPIPQAWWVKGKALERLGRIDEAIASFETAIDRVPDSEFAALSHRDLAGIYDKRGDREMAEFHRNAAEAIENGEFEGT